MSASSRSPPRWTTPSILSLASFAWSSRYSCAGSRPMTSGRGRSETGLPVQRRFRFLAARAFRFNFAAAFTSRGRGRGVLLRESCGGAGGAGNSWSVNLVSTSPRPRIGPNSMRFSICSHISTSAAWSYRVTTTASGSASNPTSDETNVAKSGARRSERSPTKPCRRDIASCSRWRRSGPAHRAP